MLVPIAEELDDRIVGVERPDTRDGGLVEDPPHDVYPERALWSEMGVDCGGVCWSGAAIDGWSGALAMGLPPSSSFRFPGLPGFPEVG